ncbi:MAG: metallophosphoesterase [Myxococcota bacterium]
MSVILHLSDLHLLAEHQPEQEQVLAALVEAIAEDAKRRGRGVDLIAITGDVFDSSTADQPQAVRAFNALLGDVHEVIGGRVPTVVIPGNHDRRVGGVVGPHRGDLFDALAAGTPPDVYVHGSDTPFLSAVVPRRFHGQPFCLLAYDSTYLPQGLLSAGGTLRQEDLLWAAAHLEGEDPDLPVVFLVHHHLVPTPITDFEPIETGDRSRLFRWGIQELLPRLVAHGDREELMMTALGAGTALSTLHTLGRAVLVLHGHKHNATARSLDATTAGQGDVIIASAGSAGTAKSLMQQTTRRAARIWPSFNVVELDEDALSIEAVSFGWKGRSRGVIDQWPLVWAGREGSQWQVAPAPVSSPKVGPRVATDEARCVLRPSRMDGRWDLECRRHVTPDLEAPRLPHYVETLDAIRGGRLELLEAGGANGHASQEPLPHDLHLGFEPARYRMVGGVPRTFAEARRLGGDAASPFGSVELLVRYTAGSASLVMAAPPRILEAGFASAVDVGTGLERPVKVQHEHGQVRVSLEPCPARTLLRFYWPLDGLRPRRVPSLVDARPAPPGTEAPVVDEAPAADADAIPLR